jgi:hypothetical protein
MQLTRLLLSLVAAGSSVWAQDEPKANSDIQGIPVRPSRGGMRETDWLTTNNLQLRTHSLTAVCA